MLFLSPQLFGPPLWCGEGMDGWEDLRKTLLGRYNEDVAKVQYLAFQEVDCAKLIRRIELVQMDKCFLSLKRAISIFFGLGYVQCKVGGCHGRTLSWPVWEVFGIQILPAGGTVEE